MRFLNRSFSFWWVFLLAVLLAGGGAVQAQEEAETAVEPAGEKAETGDAGMFPASQVFSQLEDHIRVESAERINYDQENQKIYSSARTVITIKDGTRLEADQMVLDVRLGWAEAEGNVRLVTPQGEVKADRAIYNFKENRGKVFNPKGKFAPIFFETRSQDEAGLQVLSRQEIVLRNVSITSCDLARPHYSIDAREVLIYPEERVFFHGATLRIWNIPVFYLPYFSRSLKDPSPWFFWMGLHSNMGAWFRMGYTYKHEIDFPDMQEEDRMREWSRGILTLYANAFVERGPGGGLEYDYQFQEKRHKGELDLFYLNDLNRNVQHRESDFYRYYTQRRSNGRFLGYARRERDSYSSEQQLQRYRVGAHHLSRLTEQVFLRWNVDYVSDSDLWDEALDIYERNSRKRVMERRARMSLSWAGERLAASLLLDLKDRVGRDRVTHFANPADVILDFDYQPDFPIDERRDEGIRTDRWGRAGLRAPQMSLESSWMRLFRVPLYLKTDLKLFRNLDKGLNVVSTEDDAYVNGVDWYNAILNRLRLGNRFTWTNQLGFGFGLAEREDKTYGYLDEDDFEVNGAPVAYLQPHPSMGGLTFVGPETFLIGSEPFNLKEDVSDEFRYGDFRSQLHGRFTDALSGDLIYRYRKTNEHFLGDWYAEMGNHYAREDLYNFRLRENNVTARLDYRLLAPQLWVGLTGYYNLIKDKDRYPNESISHYALSTRWQSARNTWRYDGSVGLEEQQIYHPSDSRAFIDSSLNYRTGLAYHSPSRDWWARIGFFFEEELDQPLDKNITDNSRYEIDRTDYGFEAGGGFQVGPKYKIRLDGRYENEYGTLDRLGILLERSLHDAVLFLAVTFEQDPYNPDYEVGENRPIMSFTDEIDLRVAIMPKLPSALGVSTVPVVSYIEESDADTPGDKDNNSDGVSYY